MKPGEVPSGERRERMLSTTLSSMADFAYVFDRQHRLLFANQPLLDLWGRTLEEIVGRTFTDLGYPRELAAKLQGQIEEVFTTKRVISDETSYTNPAGLEASYEYIFCPALAGDGSVDFVVGSTRHITERKSVETALRKSEVEFRMMAAAMPQIVWVKQPDGGITYFNRQWTDYTGLTLEASLGHEFHKRFHPDDAAHAQAIWDEAAASNSMYSVECRLLRADGAWRWWLIRGIPFKDDAGVVLKWIGTCTDIDELKGAQLEVSRTNRELQRQKTELRVLFDLVPAMIWFKDTENNILRVNQRVADAARLTVEEIEGKSAREIYPDLYESLHAEDLEVVRSGKPVLGMMHSAVGRDGREVWIERDKVPYFDESGKVIGIVAMAQNITERKQAAEAIRQSQKRLRDLIDGMGPSIFVALLTPRGVVVEVNRSPLVAAGLGPEDVIGKHFDETWWWARSPDARRDLRAAIDKAAGGKASRYEVRLRGITGEAMDLDFSLQAVRDEAAAVVFLVASASVITERVQAETALRESEAEFRTLSSAMPQIVWVSNTAGENIYVNSRWMEYSGIDAERSRARGWRDSVHPDDMPKMTVPWQEARRTTTTYSVEIRLRRADGEYRWWLVRGVPQLDATGAVAKWIGTCTDIDELKRAEIEISRANSELEVRVRARTAELNIARDEAERANHAKSAFLAAMSHEIRTPMNGVIGMIEVLQQTSLQDHQVQMIDLIRDSAFSLLQIIEDILDFSKIEAGKLEVVSEPLRLSEMIEKVCAMLDPLALKRNVRMKMFVDPAIPHTVLGDENRLRQVLINLAGNAIKFSGGRDQPGNVSVRATLAAREAAALTVELAVDDDGIGIDAVTQALLFTPFSQADASTTRRFGGSGLGLAISNMLVELMQGTIAVASVVNRGSTFTVRLPLVAVEAGALAPVPGQLPADSPGGARPGRASVPSRTEARERHRLILVAEDNETNRVVILQQLAVIGFAAEVAVDGREALVRWRTGEYALLLTDLHMPHMDGYALTRAIRAEEAPGRRIPIIALTANALRDEELRCLAAGMDAYLSKPVRLAQLKASIEERLAPAQAAAAPLPIAATPPADLQVLVDLVGDDPAVIDEVLETFRHSAVESSAALDLAMASDSSRDAADAAHRLKSAARSIGALRVGNLCEEIERAAKARSSGELKALLPLFHAELAAVLKFLESR